MNNGLKALINAVLAWLIIALIISFKNQIGFGDALLKPHTIIIAVISGAASYAGLMMRGLKTP